MSEIIVIKQADVEIGRVTAEKLEYAPRIASTRIHGEGKLLYQESATVDDPKLFTAKDASGKPLFVVRVSEDKEITTERV